MEAASSTADDRRRDTGLITRPLQLSYEYTHISTACEPLSIRNGFLWRSELDVAAFLYSKKRTASMSLFLSIYPHQKGDSRFRAHCHTTTAAPASQAASGGREDGQGGDITLYPIFSAPPALSSSTSVPFPTIAPFFGPSFRLHSANLVSILIFSASTFRPSVHPVSSPISVPFSLATASFCILPWDIQIRRRRV